MRYAIWGQVPRQLAEDEKSLKIWTDRFVRDERRDFLQQSKRFMNLERQIGLNGADFMQDMRTVRIVGNLYKIPRIIKSRLK
jgi:hypothetical protein